MKYRILVKWVKPDACAFRAQSSRFGLFWSDLEWENVGYHDPQYEPMRYDTREQAQAVIDRDSFDRARPPAPSPKWRVLS